jgi:hypothetical protein
MFGWVPAVQWGRAEGLEAVPGIAQGAHGRAGRAHRCRTGSPLPFCPQLPVRQPTQPSCDGPRMSGSLVMTSGMSIPPCRIATDPQILEVAPAGGSLNLRPFPLESSPVSRLRGVWLLLESLLYGSFQPVGSFELVLAVPAERVGLEGLDHLG